ncbi:MAG: glycosyltransferase [Candidatus Neomarinimicrobiota bacterium]
MLTVRNGEYPNLDFSLLEEAKKTKVKVLKTGALEPFRLFKLFSGQKSLPTFQLNQTDSAGLLNRISRWIRMNLFIPDGRVGWVPFAIIKGWKYLRNNPVDIIFTSGPPHSTHLIGRYLKWKFKLPWVADFRDPWIDLFYYKDQIRTVFARKFDKKLQFAVLNNADRIVTVSPGFRELLGQYTDQTKIQVIYNGYDEDDFGKIGCTKVNDYLNICHIGTLSRHQNPMALFEAVRQMTTKNKPAIRLHFFGTIHDSVKYSLADNNLTEIVHFHGYVSHTQIIEQIDTFQLLFLVIPVTKSNRGIIPGKIFEYIRSRVPILLIGPAESDTAKIIQMTNSGYVHDFNDVNGIKNRLSSNLSTMPNNYMQYERRNLATKLADVFNGIR